MTMTAPGRGMGDVLRADSERAVLAIPGVDEVQVNLVWEPPWTVSACPRRPDSSSGCSDPEQAPVKGRTVTEDGGPEPGLAAKGHLDLGRPHETGARGLVLGPSARPLGSAPAL